MNILRISTGLAAFLAVAVPGTADADPVDNYGDATFRFNDDGGNPFLSFPSGEDVDSHTVALGPTEFFAYVDADGEMFYNGASPGFHVVDGLIIGGGQVQLVLFITDVIGFIDCSSVFSDCDVDWEISAQLRFRNGGAITTNNCRTGSFTIEVTGRWADTVSDPFTVPALTGSGSGACGGSSGTINNFLDLGTNGTTLALYKFSGTEDATGLPLDGS